MIPPTVTLRGIWAALIALAFTILLVLLAVQTVRLEGFNLWPIKYEGCIAKSERLQTDLDNVKAAQVLALEKVEAAKEKAEQAYRNLAENTDEKLEQARVDTMDAAERYIAAHRVRPQAPDRASGGTATASEDRSAQSGDGSGTAPILASQELVTVAPDDIRICTENTIRLENVREWALSLVTVEGN